MTKKEFCKNNPVIAYYSGFGGLEAHGFQYGIDDFLYCTSRAWGDKPSYHRLKVRYRQGDAYVLLHGYRASLSDFITV